MEHRTAGDAAVSTPLQPLAADGAVCFVARRDPVSFQVVFSVTRRESPEDVEKPDTKPVPLVVHVNKKHIGTPTRYPMGPADNLGLTTQR